MKQTKCKEWFNSLEKITTFLEDEKNQGFEIKDLVSILVYYRKQWCLNNRCGLLEPIFVFRQYFLDRRGNVLAVSYIPEGLEMSLVANKELIWKALESLNNEDILSSSKKKEIKFCSYCKDLPPKLTEEDLKKKFKKVRISY